LAGKRGERFVIVSLAALYESPHGLHRIQLTGIAFAQPTLIAAYLN